MTACFFPMMIAHDNTVDSSKYQGTIRNTDLVWDKRGVITYDDKVLTEFTYINVYTTNSICS